MEYLSASYMIDLQVLYNKSENCMFECKSDTEGAVRGMNSIQNFQLDKKRSGEIFKRWLKEAGLTYREGADETGIPYDTLNNTLNGKNELGVERALKLCVVTRHTFSEYLQELCAGYEHVDFADDLHWVVRQQVEIIQAEPVDVVPNTSAVPAPTVNVTTVAMQSEVKPSISKEFEGCLQLVNAEHERSLDRFKNVHTGYLERLSHAFETTLVAKDTQIEQMQKDADKVEKAHQEHIKSALMGRDYWRKTSIFLALALLVFLTYVIWEFANIDKGLTGHLFQMISNSRIFGRLG